MKLVNKMILGLCLSAGVFSAVAGEVKAEMVSLTVAKSLPSELPFQVKPHNHPEGFSVTYLLTGEGMTGINEKSLKLDSVKTSDGKELSKTRRGGANYKMGSFAKVGDEGEFGSFSFSVNENIIGKAQGLKISGSIKVFLGDKVLEKTTSPGDLKLLKDTVAGIEVSYSENKFGGSAGIKVKGNLNKIVSVMILDEKGKEIKSNGWSGWDDQKTYNFSKLPKVGQLKLMYWNELVEQEVKF